MRFPTAQLLMDKCSSFFHSLARGLGGDHTADSLRKDAVVFVEAHSDLVYGGESLQDWIMWETGLSVPEYCECMLKLWSWGGAIEAVVLAQLYGVNVSIGSMQTDNRFTALHRFEPLSTACKDVYLTYDGTSLYNVFMAAQATDSDSTIQLKALLNMLGPKDKGADDVKDDKYGWKVVGQEMPRSDNSNEGLGAGLESEAPNTGRFHLLQSWSTAELEQVMLFERD